MITQISEQLIDRMREIWDSAPTNAQMVGQDVRIPGFVVPLVAGKAWKQSAEVMAHGCVLGGARQAALPDVPTFTELGLGGVGRAVHHQGVAAAGLRYKRHGRTLTRCGGRACPADYAFHE